MLRGVSRSLTECQTRNERRVVIQTEAATANSRIQKQEMRTADMPETFFVPWDLNESMVLFLL